MKFGLYIHIPHCLQQCSYCDFATIQNNDKDHILKYVQLLKQEFLAYRPTIPFTKIDSIYFGGGTPSLVPNYLLVSLLKLLQDNGFIFSPNIEITLEINPGTVLSQEIDLLKTAGFNRFSVGVQTFDEELLKQTKRKHSVQNSHETLSYLKEHGTLFSADILFGLPRQNLSMLEADLEHFLSYNPSHMSAYNLTIPENHFLMKGRASDQEQIEMFQLIEEKLKLSGLQRYELSNYALKNQESKHNQIYWKDHAYWGLGMSAHSYFPKETPIHLIPQENSWGLRFSNPVTFPQYEKWLSSLKAEPQTISSLRPNSLIENLTLHECLTDYCHTSLRMNTGLRDDSLEKKFSKPAFLETKRRLKKLVEQGLVSAEAKNWSLSSQGKNLSNQVFEELTFFRNDLIP